MEFVSLLILHFGLVIAALTGVFVGKKYLKLKDDNAMEEIVEEILEKKIGIDVDLTPESPEKKDSK